MTKTEELKISKRLKETSSHLPPICRQFIENEAVGKSKQTILGYAYDLKTYTEFLSRTHGGEVTDTTILNVTPAEISKYINDLKDYTSPSGSKRKNTDKGIFRKVHTIKALYNFAHTTHRAMINLAEKIELPKIKRKDRTSASAESAQRLIEAFNVKKDKSNGLKADIWNDELLRNRAIVALITTTELTNGQIAELDIDDIDLETARAFIKDYNRTINIDIYTIGTLTDYINGTPDQTLWKRDRFLPNNDEKALFLSRKRSRIAVRTIQHLLLSTITDVFGNSSPTPKPNDFKGALIGHTQGASNNTEQKEVQ